MKLELKNLILYLTRSPKHKALWGVWVMVICLISVNSVDGQGVDDVRSTNEMSNESVVELESDVGLDQMKINSAIPAKRQKPVPAVKKTEPVATPTKEKATIKPRVQYDENTAVASDATAEKVSSRPSSAVEDSPSPADMESVTDDVVLPKPENYITENQVVEMSGALRKLMEENESFKKQINDFDTQLKNLRGQKNLDSKRMSEITIERDALRKQTENIANSNSLFEQQVRDLRQQLTDKETEFLKRIHTLEEQLTEKAKQLTAVKEPTDPVAEPESLFSKPANATKVSQVTTGKRIEVTVAMAAPDAEKRSKEAFDSYLDLKAEKSKLLRDEAKIHYNMGNTYFNQGDYENAAKEYHRTLEITPEDSNAHYNLAFVSGEFLHHPRAAIKHYKQYLFLNPRAPDAQMVQQRIIEAEVFVKGDIHFDSDINQDLRKYKNEANEMSSF